MCSHSCTSMEGTSNRWIIVCMAVLVLMGLVFVSGSFSAPMFQVNQSIMIPNNDKRYDVLNKEIVDKYQDGFEAAPHPQNASNHELNRSIAWSETTLQTRHTETSPKATPKLQNEEHALVEWIEHYIAEGAGHFYLGSNNPPDSAGYEIFRRQVKPYEESGILTWWDMPSFGGSTRKVISQTDNLWSTKVLDKVKMDGLVQWLLVVDLDEFAYARPENGTMADVLCKHIPSEITQLCIPFLFYGNNGFIKQPACIVPHFTKRWKNKEGSRMHGKCVSRVANISHISVHWHHVDGGGNVIPGSPWEKYSSKLGGKGSIRLKFYRMVEENLHEWPLRLNHYQIQSLQHYRAVRNNRKQGLTSHAPNSSESFIHQWDVPSLFDDLLSEKGHWRNLKWDCNRTQGPPEWEGRIPLR